MAGFLLQTSHGGWRIFVAFIASAAIAAALALSVAPAKASELFVRYDQSQLLRIPRPVAEIIIGNPTIADISVQSKQLLVITGKSFGKTNMILLDAERNVILEHRIIVLKDQAQVVNLHRGASRESYNCSPRCNPTVTIGDESNYFKAAASNAELKIKLSEGSGTSSAPAGQ